MDGGRSKLTKWCLWALSAALLAVAAWAALGSLRQVRMAGGERDPGSVGRVSAHRIGQAVLRQLPKGDHFIAIAESRRSDENRVYAALRSKGVRLAHAWGHGESWLDGICQGIRNASDQIDRELRDAVDTVEVCLCHSFRDIDLATHSAAISHVHRGVRGLEIIGDSARVIYSPTEMLARNLSFKRAIGQYVESSAPAGEAKSSEDWPRVRVFESWQVLVDLRQPVTARRMFRGNTIVDLNQVTQQEVQELAHRMGFWLANQVQADGRMTYKYWPSRGEESSSNNMIRQFLGTICLNRLGRFRDDDQLTQLAMRNLDYNLAHFCHENGDIAYIEYGGKAKLGAAALAAIAVIESSLRGRHTRIEAALTRLVERLWNPDGSFTTFFKPVGRTGNQNFYPGEALLLLAMLFEETRDAKLLDQIMNSFRYYRSWHLAERNRNPAFVPWHTQAYYIVWRITKDEQLCDFIFTMNDWLLRMQQWERLRYQDLVGRFYKPDRPDFGPPHASSTGVYLEGLIDAFRLASEVNDAARVASYRRAIVGGLRSLMQLEFADDTDMFYVSKRQRVKGALRTTVYNNEVRVDNVAHGLMAIMKILATFSAADMSGPEFSSVGQNLPLGNR